MSLSPETFADMQRVYEQSKQYFTDDNNGNKSLQLGGLWKNDETGENECNFGFGKLVLRKMGDKEKMSDPDFGLFFVFFDEKKKEFSCKVTNLWVNRGKNCIYLSGSFGTNLNLLIFTNREKKKETHPNYYMKLSLKQTQRSVNPDEFELV